MALAQHVHAEHAELADAMLSTLWGMFEGWGLAEQDVEPQSAGTGMQTAGNASSDHTAFTLDHTVSHLIIC